jgi:hypothetical protein
MKVTVTTTEHPEGEVRRLVAWAAELLEVQDVVEDVRVTFTKYSFRGWCSGKSVLMRIGHPSKFPREVQYPGLKTAPKYTVRDWKEGLVMLAAHEFQHARQFKARARFPETKLSEIEAERVALWALHRYRDPENQVALVEALARAEEQVQARAAAKRERREEKQAKERDPARRAEALRAKIKAWETKRKRAETMLKKYGRRLRRLERQAQKETR